MDDAGTAPRTVHVALEEVARWRADLELRNKQEIVEVEQEMESLRTAVTNLQQQLDALARFRDDLGHRDEKVPAEETDRSYKAIFSALLEQSDALGMRGARVATAQEAQGSAMEAAAKEPGIAAALAEYQQFKDTVEPTLKALPESYRGVMMAHHQGIVKRLRDHFGSVNLAPISVDAPGMQVDVVYAVDAPDGTPDVLMLVLPVPEQTHSQWEKRQEGLDTWLAARVIQGVYAACEACGVPAPQAAFGGHQGLLAIELDVSSANGDLAQRVQETVDQVLSRAPELAGAKVTARAHAVTVDHMLPPEEGEEELEEVSNA